MPSSRQARMMRMAISPRLATRIFFNIPVEPVEVTAFEKSAQGSTGAYASRVGGTENVPETRGLFRLEQDDGLCAASARDHVELAEADLDVRDGRLDGRLVDELVRRGGSRRPARSEEDAVEAFLLAEVFALDGDLVPGLQGIGRDLRDFGP